MGNLTRHNPFLALEGSLGGIRYNGALFICSSSCSHANYVIQKPVGTVLHIGLKGACPVGFDWSIKLPVVEGWVGRQKHPRNLRFLGRDQGRWKWRLYCAENENGGDGGDGYAGKVQEGERAEM